MMLREIREKVINLLIMGLGKLSVTQDTIWMYQLTPTPTSLVD